MWIECGADDPSWNYIDNLFEHEINLIDRDQNCDKTSGLF